MCDTFLVRPNYSADGSLLFGKNSDREPRERLLIQRVPATRHGASRLRCTYIEIPQQEKTYEVLMARPAQMWGAEMGVNEHGLVIGNEAVFTREKIRKKNTGLTGMDLLRLALERCRNCEEALQCITNLLETYGQDACGGYENRRFYYHNSFLIGDGNGDAWLLETAGRHWAARKVESAQSISNGLVIGKDHERISESLSDRADKLHFSEQFSDFLYTGLSRCRLRQSVSQAALKSGFDWTKAQELLSSHDHGPPFTPKRSGTGSICMHASGFTNPHQTTGSMIAVVRPGGRHTVWFTGCPAPCVSVYLPFFFGGNSLRQPGPDLWEAGNALQHKVCEDYEARKKIFERERLARQRALREREAELIQTDASPQALDAFSKRSLELAINDYKSYYARF